MLKNIKATCSIIKCQYFNFMFYTNHASKLVSDIAHDICKLNSPFLINISIFKIDEGVNYDPHFVITTNNYFE